MTDPPDWAAHTPYVPPQPTSWVATRKVTAGTVTAGVTAVAIWVLDWTGITLPPSLAAVLTGLLTAGMAYLIPEGPANPPGRHTAA